MTNPIDTEPPVGVTAIEQAAIRIADHVRTTPILDAEVGGQPLHLKLECLQVGGSFKARGAFNCLLSAPDVRQRGVVAASGGNHGIAVALAARRLGVRADVFVPAIASPAKLAALRALGAQMHVGGASYDEALAASEAFVARTGAVRSHAYDLPETVAGQGTLAREWEQQVDRLPDTILVAVGGGGLIAGIAAWFSGRVRVVAVESTGCPTLHAARAAGVPVDVAVSGLAADSLGARRIGAIAFAITQRYVHDTLLVDDDAIRAAQRAAWAQLRVALEPGGASALAAVLSGAYRPAARERVGVLLCGANLDPGTLAA